MDQKLLEKIKKIGDLYGILKINQTEDISSIEKAYRNQARIWHPDKNKAPEARGVFENLTIAKEILCDEANKEAYDRYIKNQKFHEERVTTLNKDRKKFADDIIKREKAEEERMKQEAQQKESKQSKYYEEMDKMKKEWKEDEEKRKADYETSKEYKNFQFLERQKETESKEYSMIKVKWSKNVNMDYTEDILKLMFSPFGLINGIVVIPNKRKALIEYKLRLSAEKAVESNKDKDIEDGLKVKLMVKGDKKSEDNEPSKKAKPKDPTTLDSSNLAKIANLYNRTSKVIVGSRDQELRRMEEKERLMREILEKNGLDV